ncbi:MAG: hypothetical protein KUG77_02445, partial [Nannocystaceae bacterium]|nr:hypothetical protein [Nannocystaceae bacterium]
MARIVAEGPAEVDRTGSAAHMARVVAARLPGAGRTGPELGAGRMARGSPAARRDLSLIHI